MTYYVLHYGYGQDGGFGDYSAPYWSDKPLEIDGRTVWFLTEEYAHKAARLLSNAAAEVFYSQEDRGSHTGDFPMEYEARAIQPPNGLSFTSVEKAVQAVTEYHKDAWPLTMYDGDEDYEDDYEAWVDDEDYKSSVVYSGGIASPDSLR